MAARAHAIHDYSFAGAAERPRRQVWLPDDYDEVVLPRRHSSLSVALVLSAVLASALVGGVAYTLYWWGAPQLSETPTEPARTWEPDATFMELNVVKALQGPALAPPKAALEAAQPIVNVQDLPQAPPPARATQQAPREHEVILHDSAPGFQESLPQPAGPAAPALTEPMLPDPILPKKEAPTTPEVPYPNPTTTPPEMAAPPVAGDGLDLPKLDPENPY